MKAAFTTSEKRACTATTLLGLITLVLFALVALVFAGIGGTAAAFSRFGGSSTTNYRCETPIGGPTTCECKGYIDCKAMVENECQKDNGASVIVCTPDGANCCCDSVGGSDCTPPPSTNTYPTSGGFATGTTYLR